MVAGSVQNCTFTNNRVGGTGGGLFQNNYRGNVASCVFNTNSAKSGGAIYQNAATGVTSDSMFTGNGAEKGGAVYQVRANHLHHVCTAFCWVNLDNLLQPLLVDMQLLYSMCIL